MSSVIEPTTSEPDPAVIQMSYQRAIDHISNVIFSNATNVEDESEADISHQFFLAQDTLGKYVTLDYELKESIQKVSARIRSYIQDPSLRRPLSFLMLASPGSGKSFFVKCLADRLHDAKVTAVTCNVATFRDFGDIVPALEAVRNLKVIDKMPLMFLDEFDRVDDMSPYLPLLWDGEFSLGHSILKLGKLIIIMAGSRQEIRQYMTSKTIAIPSSKNNNVSAKKKAKLFAARKQDPAKKGGVLKLQDCMSRINGGFIEVPQMDDINIMPDKQSPVWIADKVCLTVSMLHQRFGEQLSIIPLSLLRFIVANYFEYGARSIAHLIDMIAIDASINTDHKITVDHLNSLPLFSVDMYIKSSLVHHIRLRRRIEITINEWNKLFSCKTMVRITHTASR